MFLRFPARATRYHSILVSETEAASSFLRSCRRTRNLADVLRNNVPKGRLTSDNCRARDYLDSLEVKEIRFRRRTAG